MNVQRRRGPLALPLTALTALTALGALVALVLGTAGGLLAGLRGPALGPATAGDAALAADVRAAFTSDRGFVSLSVARVRDGQLTFAGLGEHGDAPPTRDTPYELGSITKTFTGALLADAVDRGEVTLLDPVSTYLPELAATPAGASTLRQLATHTAGLPPFPTSSAPTVALRVLGNDNPYAGSVADLLAATRTSRLSQPDTYRYSNLGVALLGHALARAAQAPDWATLLQQRILDPLGMTRTVVVDQADRAPAGVATPHRANGWPAPFWTGSAFAPAGSSTVTTAGDLATWAGALLDGSAPGSSAMEPLADISGGRIGLAWHVREVDGPETDGRVVDGRDVDGRAITWHNGGTGGSRTMLALDRERGQAVLLLANSERDVDTAGLQLAATGPDVPLQAVDARSPDWRGLLAWNTVGLLLLGAAVVRWRSGRGWLLLDGALAALTGLLVLLVHGPWLLVPTALWVGIAAATAAFGVPASLRPGGPPAISRRRLGTSLAGTAVVLALALWTL